MQKKISRIKTAIIVLLVLANILVWLTIAHINFRYVNFEVRSCPVVELKAPETIYTYMDKERIKEKIRELMDTPHLYFEKDFKEENKIGDSSPLRRVVRIDRDVDLYDYIVGYTHELCHIKYMTKNDTFVSYKTFVHLYESNDVDFMLCSIVYANSVLCGDFKGTDYDCGYYILEYLEQHNYDYLIKLQEWL